MRVAFVLGRDVLPMYFSKFSRHDFTVPQLFACLVLKEHQRKTYRDVEALLRDAPHWCRQIGMMRVPDHNTLCRAFHALNLQRRSGKLLDRGWCSGSPLPSSWARSSHWTRRSTTRVTAAVITSSVAGSSPVAERQAHHHRRRRRRRRINR